jgi:hypothetical protein
VKDNMVGAVMALMDESAWRGKVFLGGSTGTRWATIRGDITPYPF